jgi:hypothetical protein
MKNWKVWVSIFGALAIIAGVLFATPILGPSGSAAEPTDPGEFKLYAGQTIDAGDGEVTNDCDSLDFTIDPNCSIGCIKIEIYDNFAALPSGNPPPGGFTHSYNCALPQVWLMEEFTFEIPFTPGAWTGGSVIIALHADTEGCGGVYTDNTAWACAETDPGDCPDDWPGASKWVYYFYYDYVDCVS